MAWETTIENRQFVIRREEPADYAAIESLIREAFVGEPHAEGDEAEFVDRLRRDGSHLPALALVCETDGRIVGQILMSRLGHPPPMQPVFALLAIVSVMRGWRSLCIASRLIKLALVQATGMGFDAVIVLGDPAFYGRFGFRTGAGFGITNTNGFEEQYVMVRELRPGRLHNCSATITLPT